MKKLRICLLLVLTVCMLWGCGAKSAASGDAAYGTYAETTVEEAAYEMSANGAGETVQSLPENRKWVITMDISAETENMDEALPALNARIAELGGYIENQRIDRDSYGTRQFRNASMVVRIPAARADEFVQALDSMTNVTSNAKSVKDITLTYADTEGRLTALRTEEARLLELMAQADNMSDLLQIEERLTRVRYQLESYTSQLKTYDNQVDYATIDLYLSQVQQYTPVEKEGFFARISKGFRKSVKDLGEGMVDFTVWVIVELPYLALWALIGWAVVGISRKIRRTRKGERKPFWKRKDNSNQQK